MTRNDRLLAAAWIGYIVCLVSGFTVLNLSKSLGEQHDRLAALRFEISSAMVQQEQPEKFLKKTLDYLDQEMATNSAQEDFYGLVYQVLIVVGPMCMLAAFYFGRRSESEPNGEVAESSQVTLRANENKLNREQASK